MKKPTGYVFYRGASLIDGVPVIGIVIVGDSSNPKTGNMLQTYILRADMLPLDAIRSGADISICGKCPQRGRLSQATIDAHGVPKDRSCYVNVGNGATIVFKAWLRGIYPDATDTASADYAAMLKACADRPLRLGTYGDPMAIPAARWHALARVSSGRTGYSHQWRNVDIDEEQRASIMLLCMASADSADDAAAARAAGLRYFRVRTADEPLQPREIQCPAAAESGKRLQCVDCLACHGSSKASAASVAIIAHGTLAARFTARRTAVVH